MLAFMSVLLKDEQARAAEPGLCFTEQYNARVCLGVVPDAFLLADHANTGSLSIIDAWLHMKTTFVTEKECKLPACMQITISARLCFVTTQYDARVTVSEGTKLKLSPC